MISDLVRRMVRLSCLGVCLGLCLGATSATAADSAADSAHGPDGTGLYLAAGYTMVYAPDDTLDVFDSSTASTALLDYDLGFRAGSISAGYGFANGLRAELEAGFRRNELEVIDFSDDRGQLNTGAEDAVEALTGFANLYYEFNPPLAIRPYLGAGVGVARVSYNGNFRVRNGFTFSESPLFDTRDSAFAWQVIAGASIAFTRRTRLSAEYRYWQTGELEFSGNATGSSGAPESTFRTSHKLHMAGLQLQFFPSVKKSVKKSDTSNRVARDRSVDQGRASKKGGFYASSHFGVVAAEDSDIDDNSTDTNFDAFDLGPAGGLAVGYEWQSSRGWPMRAELEASRFSSAADLVDFGKLAGEDRLRGDATTTAIAVNVFVERARRPGLRPYAGIGFGYADVDYDIQLRRPQPGFESLAFLEDSAGSPTVQGLLGVRVELAQQLSVNLGYRYWWAPLLRLNNPAGERVETEHSAHLIQLGVQWRPR